MFSKCEKGRGAVSRTLVKKKNTPQNDDAARHKTLRGGAGRRRVKGRRVFLFERIGFDEYADVNKMVWCKSAQDALSDAIMLI